MASVTFIVQVALIVVAALVAIGVTIDSLRHRILLRQAVRNVGRHPKQTTIVILGLMIGSAIISASLVAGESANFGVQKAVFDALGETDETIRLDSLNFFSDAVLDQALADEEAMAYFDAIAPNIIWPSTSETLDGDLFEPTVYWIGYDPTLDQGFGRFELQGGGSTFGRELGVNEILISADLADKLELGTGDALRMLYSLPADPLIPQITVIEDTLTGAGGGALQSITGLLDPILGEEPTLSESTYPLDVDEDTEQITAVLAWDPRIGGQLPLATLDVSLLSPSGERYGASSFRATPEVPLVVNVTREDVGGAFEVGTWQLAVRADVALEQPFVALGLVFEPIFDLEELAQKARELQGQARDLGFEVNLQDLFLGDPRTVELEIAGVTDGGKGKQFDFDLIVFQRIDRMQQLLERENQVNLVKFSNPGGVLEGAAGTEEALAILDRIINETKALRPGDAATQNLEPRDVKRLFLEIAEDVGAGTTGLILFAGSLSVITGLFLIINIFTMLAEERRHELGMARAVGLTQKDLIRGFSYEGSLYAVASAAIGSVLGIGLAFVMLSILNLILGQLGTVPPLPFSPSFLSFFTALAAGSLLTFTTIFVTSFRTARMNIVRAIRSIEEPERTGTRFDFAIGLGALIVGALYTTYGWLPIEKVYPLTPKVLGPLIVAIGLGLLLRKSLPKKILYPSVAFALAVFGFLPSYFLITEYSNIDEANIVGPLRGVLLTLCVVVMISFWERGPRLMARFVSGIRGLRPVAIPAFSYPQHKRFRTGMTLAMFSIVVLSVGVLSIFGALLEVPVERQTGGWDVEATTTIRVDDLDAILQGTVGPGVIEQRVDFAEFYTPDLDLITVNGERTGQYQTPVHHSIYGYGEDFIQSDQTFRLLFKDERYATDAEAYQAVLENDDLVIVSYQYSTNERNQDLSFTVGDRLQINIGTTPIEYTIIGIQEQYHFNGIFLADDTVQELFPGQTRGFYLYELFEDDQAPDIAKDIERDGKNAGLNAEPSQQLVEEEQEVLQQLLAAMKLFLGIGLVVGMISLGIITSRSVLERRQEIGMLRAIGYTRNLIVRIFLTEVTVTILIGTAIGLFCAGIVSFGVWYVVIRPLQFPFVVPVGELALLSLITFVIAFVFTIGPVRKAGKVSAAEALRYSE